MLECTTNQEVSEELERIVKDPDFVVNDIFFLSKYKHKVENEQDKEEIKSVVVLQPQPGGGRHPPKPRGCVLGG